MDKLLDHLPFDINTLKQMVAQTLLTKDSLVWKQGMEDWKKAECVSELQLLFNSVNVPPIPKEVK